MKISAFGGWRALAVFLFFCALTSPFMFQMYYEKDFYGYRVPYTSAFISTTNYTIQRYASKQNASKILVTTYMRSGSSFVGELLRFGGNVFYVFEPFWSVYEKTFRTDTEVCMRNGTCYIPTKTLHKINKTMEIIKLIFDCRISELPKEVLKSFTNFPFTSGYSRRCKSILSKRQRWKSREQDLHSNRREWCFSRWQRACKEASARVIKTIRLSPRLLKEIQAFVNDVKLLHLVRHPLGILNSRINIGEISERNVHLSARHLCQLMKRDVLYIKDELRKNKQAVLPLSFECMVSNPVVVATKLFGRLGLNYSTETENWIKEHTDRRSAGKTSTGPLKPNTNEGKSHIANGTFKIRKTHSKEIAKAWKSALSEEIVEGVNAVCHDLYKEVGFFESDDGIDLSTYGGEFC